MAADPDKSKVPKRDAGYTETPLEIGAPADARCRGCAHFVPPEQSGWGDPSKGVCKVVEGEIGEDDVCRRFYADIGVFADDKMGNAVRLSQILDRGGTESWDSRDRTTFLTKIRRRITNVITLRSEEDAARER